MNDLNTGLYLALQSYMKFDHGKLVAQNYTLLGIYFVQCSILIVNSEEQDPVSEASDGKHPKNYSHVDCDERIQAKVRII